MVPVFAEHRSAPLSTAQIAERILLGLCSRGSIGRWFQCGVQCLSALAASAQRLAGVRMVQRFGVYGKLGLVFSVGVRGAFFRWGVFCAFFDFIKWYHCFCGFGCFEVEV